MSPYAARMPGKVKGGCEVDVQDEREGLIRTLLVELGGQILVLVSREKLKEPTFSAKLNDRFWLTNAWQNPKHFAAKFSSSPHNECIVWREGSSYCRQLSKGDIPLSLACSELLTLRARNYNCRIDAESETGAGGGRNEHGGELGQHHT